MVRPKSITRAWSHEELQKLVQAVDAGLTPFRAGVKLKRSAIAVQCKARDIGKPFKTICELKRELKAKIDAAAMIAAHHVPPPKR